MRTAGLTMVAIVILVVIAALVMGRKTPAGKGATHRGGGADLRFPLIASRRAATTVAQWLYPWWGAGGGAPIHGANIGHTTRDGRASAMHCDPFTWFHVAKYISSAGAFIVGLNGRGKSTLIKRWMIFYDAWGIKCMVLGDVKGEYRDLVRAMGGQVIELGYERGALNPLDMGDAVRAAAAIVAKGEREGDKRTLALGKQLLKDAKVRRRLCVEAILTAHDGTAPNGFEVDLLGVALAILDALWVETGQGRQMILSDLLELFEKPTEKLQKAAQARGSMDRYWANVDHLVKTLSAITREEGLGDVFNRPTNVTMRRDTHVVFDLSGVHKDDKELRGALQVACWTIGFGQISVSHAMSDAGLEPFQRYCAIQDELWDAFASGQGMVARHNALTRLDRHEGLVTIKCTHSPTDMTAISEADRAAAMGIMARTPLLVCFALSPADGEVLREHITRFSDNEIEALVALSDPLDWQAPTDERPPGQGHAAVKIGRRAALMFEMDLTEAEKDVSFTNQRWADAA